jgi:hypothetical protein
MVRWLFSTNAKDLKLTKFIEARAAHSAALAKASLRLVSAFKKFQLKYLTTVKVMFFLEKTSFIIMFISATILICVLLNPDFWEIKLSSNIVHAMGTDNENLSTTVTGTLNEVNNTLNEVNKTLSSVREEGIKVDVSPNVRQVVDIAASSLTVSAGVYTGTKLAEMTPSLAGKTAVVAGTVLATVAAKTIIQETGKNDLFTIKTDNSSDNFEPVENPQSPSNNDWTINSPHESNSLDLSTLLSSLESTDSLQRIMESLLTLSMVSFTLTLYVLITVILNLKDFTKVKWLNDNPKLLKFIERIKVARTSVVIPILLLLLFISLISCYGSYSVLKALLIYKSSVM